MYENWLFLFAAGFQKEPRFSDLICCPDQKKKHTKTLMDESSIPWIRRVIHPGCFREIPSLPVFLLYFTVPSKTPQGTLTVSSTPWKINGWNLQITHLERKKSSKTSMIYMFHVNLQECTRTVFLPPPGLTDMTGWSRHRGGQCHRDMWGSWCLQQWGSSERWSDNMYILRGSGYLVSG